MVVYGALARHREADSAALTLPLFARSLIYGMQTIPHGHLKRAIEDALLLRDARRAAPVFTFFNNRLSASPWVDRRASRRILGELLVRGLAAGGERIRTFGPASKETAVGRRTRPNIAVSREDLRLITPPS